VIPAGLLTSTDNTLTSACFRTPPSTQRESASFTGNLPYFGLDWPQTNPHHASEEGYPSLLNVTVLFMKNGNEGSE
jgi:hypothetical protein